jgi:hypothetical protein
LINLNRSPDGGKMYKKIALLVSILGLPSVALAEWTPLITATMFDGIRADMLVVVGSVLGLFLIVFGAAMLMRTTGR